MTVLNLNALGVTLGDPLFANLSLTINKGDRIGLVAANGRGKSTLLACMAGLHEPTEGAITRARGLRTGLVTQTVPPEALTSTFYDWVLGALPDDQADYESWRVDVALDALEIPETVQHQTLGALSGGWQRTAVLAAAWVLEPDLLLLDEPTNHLDLSRIAALERWLVALPKDMPVVITAHDRAFLDATTTHTLFLRPEESRVFPLPYSRARAALDAADAADARRHANDLNKAQTLRRQAANLKNVGVNSGSDLLLTKTKQLTDRANRLEEAAKPAHRDARAGTIALNHQNTHAKALVTLDDAEVSAPDGRVLYRTGKKWIARGDRVVLLGANGTGKTQLVRLVAEALQGQGGSVRCAGAVVAGYSDQHLSHLAPQATPFDTLTGQFDMGDQAARRALAGAGLAFDKQTAPIKSLSGGERARLALLILRFKTPNFYLLDEPTNHLDIEGQEALEAELCADQASCLLVSHDRHFLTAVGTRFWWIRNRQLDEIDSAEMFFAHQTTGS